MCISANYRLGRATRFPEHVIDAKRVIAWVREHGSEHGADPAMIFVAGTSAGAHIAAIAALTPNDPAFQPDFEGMETSVAAAVLLSGYYGPLGRTRLPSAPEAYRRADAPPFLVAHGQLDVLVPADRARHFVDRLRAKSFESGRLRRAARGVALVRPLSLDSVRARHRRDRGLRCPGQVAPCGSGELALTSILGIVPSMLRSMSRL